MSAEDEPRQLWCAVITLAVEDATSSLGQNIQRNREIASARLWLTKPSRDFAEVCRLAGYEHNRVRSQVINRIEQAAQLDCPPPPKPRKTYRSRPATTNEGYEVSASQRS